MSNDQKCKYFIDICWTSRQVALPLPLILSMYSLHCNIPSTGTSSTRLIQQSCKLTGQIIKDDVGETHAISSTMVHHGFSLPPVLVSKLGKQTGLRRVYLKKTRHEEEQNMDRWTEESLERLNR